MRKLKFLLATFMAFIILTSNIVLAEDTSYEDIDAGTLTQKEINDRIKDYKKEHPLTPSLINSNKKENDISIKHFGGGLMHYHEIYNLSSPYAVYSSWREVGSAFNDRSIADTFQFSFGVTLNNSMSCNISYSLSQIEAEVGFDTSWAESYTWSYSMTVPPHTVAILNLRHKSYRTDFDCSTTYWYEYYPFIETIEGSGSATQWHSPQYWSYEE